MAKALKLMLAAQLEEDLEGSAGVLLLDPGPMTVASVEAFRTDLREKAGGARMRVIHNRTARYAFEKLFDDTEALTAELTGGSAVAYGGEGPIPIAKVVKDWQKKLKTLRVKAAVADGEVLIGAEADALADMPDLPQLKGMLASALIGSARGIATSLQAVYGGLARCIQARVDESGESEGEAAAE
jgi:large subunit ribosomal protein L10